MSELLTIISCIFGVLGGSGTLITYLLYRKQSKRIKNAEAVEQEVSTLRATVETLQKNYEFYVEQLKQAQCLLGEREKYIETLYRDKNIIEIKHAKNKGAMNRAYECSFCKDTSQCPVIIQRSKNDEEFLKIIEKNV